MFGTYPLYGLFPAEQVFVTARIVPLQVQRGAVLGLVHYLPGTEVCVQLSGDAVLRSDARWACLRGHALQPRVLAGPKGRLP